ncbi:MAG: PIN domain nuclease [Bacteroidetes bacterium]|jgi:predicted nucleic acid-binding protein|nr:MAG: PIN domain nuclease [Bacteroidota bacterium]
MGLKDSFIQKVFFLDTAPLIYYIEGQSNYKEKLIELFNASHNGEIYFQTSALTILEVLVQPLRLKKLKLAKQYEEILTNSANLVVFDIDIEISIQAAKLRANYNLKTPDSIQIATAIEKNADFFLTNDKNLTRVNEIEILTLDKI